MQINLREKERKKKQAAKPAINTKNNKFNNFDGRSYDMDDLERKLDSAVSTIK